MMPRDLGMGGQLGEGRAFFVATKLLRSELWRVQPLVVAHVGAHHPVGERHVVLKPPRQELQHLLGGLAVSPASMPLSELTPRLRTVSCCSCAT